MMRHEETQNTTPITCTFSITYLKRCKYLADTHTSISLLYVQWRRESYRWFGFFFCVKVLLTGSHTTTHLASWKVYYRDPEIHSILFCMQRDTNSHQLKYTPCSVQDVARLTISKKSLCQTPTSWWVSSINRQSTFHQFSQHAHIHPVWMERKTELDFRFTTKAGNVQLGWERGQMTVTVVTVLYTPPPQSPCPVWRPALNLP